MRNPERINEFCTELAKQWHKVPDWRFGQFISNVLGAYPGDIFFPEDDEMLDFIQNYFKKENASPYYSAQ